MWMVRMNGGKYGRRHEREFNHIIVNKLSSIYCKIILLLVPTFSSPAPCLSELIEKLFLGRLEFHPHRLQDKILRYYGLLLRPKNGI